MGSSGNQGVMQVQTTDGEKDKKVTISKAELTGKYYLYVCIVDLEDRAGNKINATI